MAVRRRVDRAELALDRDRLAAIPGSEVLDAILFGPGEDLVTIGGESRRGGASRAGKSNLQSLVLGGGILEVERRFEVRTILVQLDHDRLRAQGDRRFGARGDRLTGS